MKSNFMCINYYVYESIGCFQRSYALHLSETFGLVYESTWISGLEVCFFFAIWTRNDEMTSFCIDTQAFFLSWVFFLILCLYEDP